MSGGDDGLLQQELRHLQAHWERSGQDWRDRSRDDFAAQHLDDLVAGLHEAAKAITTIEALINEAKRQCL